MPAHSLHGGKQSYSAALPNRRSKCAQPSRSGNTLPVIAGGSILPRAAATSSPRTVQERRRWGCEMGCRYDTPNVPWGVRESAPMRARQINRESVSERAGRGEAGCGASEFFRVKRFSSGPSFGRIGNRLESLSLSLSFSVLPAGGSNREGYYVEAFSKNGRSNIMELP